jgi:hypothetical protein
MPQASTSIKFFACVLPDFYATMNACDRYLYRWLEQIPETARPVYLSNELARIAQATTDQQNQQLDNCLASRYASPANPTPGLQLAVASRLAGGGLSRASSFASASSASKIAKLSLSFAAGAGTPPPPAPCTLGADPATATKIPYPFLHKLDKVGINYFPYNTMVAFPNAGGGSSYASGIGPWAGSKVFMVYSLNNQTMGSVQGSFNLIAHLQSNKVFEHWVRFKPFNTPPPPASLLQRCEPFNPAALQIETSVPYNPEAVEGLRGQGWQVYVEYTHEESGESWVVGRWFETNEGWSPVSLGGYAADQTFWDYFPDDLATSPLQEGTWYHRVCVNDFKRIPTALRILYNNLEMDQGYSSITPMVTMPYLPGVTQGIASCDETVTLRTVGASKASFRIVDIQTVAGVGVLCKLKVVNELHIAACIVTPFLSGLSNRLNWSTNQQDFYCPTVWVVRNLAAHSESAPLSVLLPVGMINPGTYDLLDRHWRNSVAVEGYAAPSDQFADGVYGSSSGAGNIGSWPPPAYQVSSTPKLEAFLLAGYRADGQKIWHSPWDSSANPNRVVLTLALQKAPGAEIPVTYDPRFAGNTTPSYTDQVPFRCYIAWSAEYKISNNPETWEVRSGIEVLSLDLPTALSRYGRRLTLTVAEGRPQWSAYYGKWVTVFNRWPGGEENELEAYLVDQKLRPSFRAAWGWRNFQYTSLKKPYLTTGVFWCYDTQAYVDRAGYLQALVVIKETTSSTSFVVALVGYW